MKKDKMKEYKTIVETILLNFNFKIIHMNILLVKLTMI